MEEENISRETLRGVVEMSPIEIAELKVLKERLGRQEKAPDEIRQEFLWKSKLLQAGIPPPYWDLTFEHFKGDDKAKAITLRYIDMLDEAFRDGMGLLFNGKHGTGKTMLSCLIAKEALKKGFTIRYLDITKILDMIMTGFGDKEVKQRLVLQLKTLFHL